MPPALARDFKEFKAYFVPVDFGTIADDDCRCRFESTPARTHGRTARGMAAVARRVLAEGRNGAGGGIRTPDLGITNALLYP